ncbi:MAG: hypothetical protein ACREMY_07825 [bacterium]
MSDAQPTWMMRHDVPDDPTLLAAPGRVALRHAHLDHILRMTIKTLGNVSVQEALDATAFEGSRTLRDRVRRLARRRLGEGTALIKLQAVLERARRATEERNDLLHSPWGQVVDGEMQIRTVDHQWKDLPTASDLSALGVEIASITDELNDARLEGYIFEGLKSRPPR